MNWVHFTVSLGAAFVLGAAIGAERQWRQRMAGLRTNALVSVGAAMFVLLGSGFVPGGDGMRVAAQVVSGIGFLGAGVIMRDGLNVRGLNTAATLWCSAAVGTLCGTGWRWQAALGTAAVLLANMVLRPLARRMDRRPNFAKDEDVETLYVLRVTCRNDSEGHLRALLLQVVQPLSLALRALHSEDVDASDKVDIRAALLSARREDSVLEQIVARLTLEPAVTAVSWAIIAQDAESELTLDYAGSGRNSI
jgi:putative Mg2+ transporter-C (MgtC) family protein